MTKTVFPNRMVAHIWAQQSQEEGRSNNGNFWFQGETLYSYRTPIARLMNVKRKGQVALVSSISYSPTTASKHLSAVHRSVNAAYTFYVPTLAMADQGRAHRLDHAENLAYLTEAYSKEIARMKRARDIGSDYRREHLVRLYNAAKDYANVFGLGTLKLQAPADAMNDIEAHHAARNTPEQRAKRAKEQARRDAAKAAKDELLRQEFAVQVAAWQAGKLSLSDIRGLNRFGTVYLRVKGQNLETSMGATVPLAHAIKAFRFVKACKDAGRSWERNGHTIHVGHFTVDSIAADGTMRAGCHVIGWDQIEQAAKAAGVWDAPASDEALQPSGRAA